MREDSDIGASNEAEMISILTAPPCCHYAGGDSRITPDRDVNGNVAWL